jgi:hypothetical protein
MTPAAWRQRPLPCCAMKLRGPGLCCAPQGALAPRGADVDAVPKLGRGAEREQGARGKALKGAMTVDARGPPGAARSFGWYWVPALTENAGVRALRMTLPEDR